MSVSTATPEKLPDIETLRRLTQSIATLDAIISPEWGYRYYSYNSKWGQNEAMASMRNGSGDDWFLLFDLQGAALKGFAHEYPLARDASFAARIQETVPPTFASFLHEAAFSMEKATFCIWRGHADPHWNIVSAINGRASPEKDGSAVMIGILDGNPETYRGFAKDYHEREIPLATIQAIYKHQALTEDLVSILNPECTLSDITNDVAVIGYPIGSR